MDNFAEYCGNDIAYFKLFIDINSIFFIDVYQPGNLND